MDELMEVSVSVVVYGTVDLIALIIFVHMFNKLN